VNVANWYITLTSLPGWDGITVHPGGGVRVGALAAGLVGVAPGGVVYFCP